MKHTPNTIEAVTKYTTLIDHLSIGVIMISKDFRIIEKNRIIDEWFPINQDAEVDTQYCFHVLNCDKKIGFCDDCQTKRAFDTSESIEVIKKKVTLSGIRDFKVVSTPIFDDSGEAVAVIETLEDITESKLTEETLRQNESKLRETLTRFNQLANQSRSVIWEVDADGLYTYVSDNVEKEWGYRPEEMVGKLHYYDIYPVQYREEFKTIGLNIIKSKQNITGLQNPIMTKDGQVRWVMSAGITVIDDAGEGIGFKGIDTDMTSLKQVEVALKKNQLFLSNLIEHSGTLICAKDRFGKYTLVNQNWETITGLKREVTLGKTDLELFPAEIAKNFMANDREVMEFAKSIEVEEYLDDESGRRTFLSIKFPMYDEKERIDGICAIITEITARKEAEEKVRYLATHDYLTGLLGLRTLKEQMPLIQGIAQRHDEKVAIMFLDLDGFKAVNDTYGHDAGDDVLKMVAKRINNGIRDTDIASRIGGDEFVLLISSLHNREEAVQIAEKLKTSIEKPIDINGSSASVGVSIGISIFPDDGHDAETLVKIADSRMYEIKKSSR